MSKEYPCVYFREGGLCSYGGDLSEANICVFGPCENETPSRGDMIRRMSDEELICFINKLDSGNDVLGFCRKLPECDADLETDRLIPSERCQQCLMEWIRGPARGRESWQ